MMVQMLVQDQMKLFHGVKLKLGQKVLKYMLKFLLYFLL